MSRAHEVQTLHDVLDQRLVISLYQPVVDLDRQVVSGYEALARGPAGPLHSPLALLDAARASGELRELDWLCREQAVAGARAAGLRYPLSLFVNAEPESLLATTEDDRRWKAFNDVRCYAEITERALVRDPAALLHTIDRVRAQDWGIAMDDVGAVPESLALLPLLQPDVVKLDMRLLHDQPVGPADTDVAKVLHAALAQAQSSGAVVVAEGIETERHLDLAMAYGAQYGQGYLLGRPGPLPAVLVSPPTGMPLLPRVVDRSTSPGPFAAVAGRVTTRRLTSASVFELVRQLLAHAASLDPAPVVLITSDRRLPPELVGLVRALDALPLRGVLGHEQPGLDVVPLAAGDPACDDLTVVVLAPFFCAALVARTTLGDGRQLLDAALTFDRHLAVTVADCLADRLGNA